ncbi:MAG: NAD-dependent succinate-semialdehyde dehydrogenase [Sulfuricellaceae bacterium]|jgi:succinate-semialdehyde dehydrogenase/glutarate-semialdehyde dehydrogenase
MPHASVNPADGRLIASYPDWDSGALNNALELAHVAWRTWRFTSFDHRAELMHEACLHLRANLEAHATLISEEMGKPLREARAEVEKCALTCEYYALWARHFLQDEPVESDAGRSYVTYQPLGTLLAVMPWNFPYWQVFRAAVPALMAGNAVALKHASNVPRIALALEKLFRDSGFPEGIFTTLMIGAGQVAEAIASPFVHAVTLTGSENAGRRVAETAGRHLKKCVLELGGSDPFIVFADADLEAAANAAIASRYQNCGQSCIAAKRLILAPEIADRFVSLLVAKAEELKVGDPLSEDTQIGPMARTDLRDELHRQVMDSIDQGARPLLGCQPLPGEGAYYPPSVLDRVTPGMRAYREELFGPVMAVIRAEDEEDALRIANDTPFGLGASLWSQDTRRAEMLSAAIEAGGTFINGMVKSDPRLPFGGIKASGFGRELSYHGIREFVNAKTVWLR